MLTVLVIHKSSGRKVLLEADRVEFQDEDGPGQGLLVCRDDNNSAHHYSPSKDSEDARDVYVMNDAGQTVARYTL